MGDASSVRGAAEGGDAVLHLAAVVAERPPAVTFERVNVEGTRNVVAEAERAHVPRLVHVSSLGADRGASAYHRSKRMGEEIARSFSRAWLVGRGAGQPTPAAAALVRRALSACGEAPPRPRPRWRRWPRA
ncbi:uncharacterized protein SOCEGT47_020490 [Sorangium cellulosum]|uniref:3-beta hydroxysteroid dehydrogenase/isomerase domain-containing protein n=1 Tax=Sorangium cellulosum TaxID=56 RepID=A0A4P2PYF8_SORCE|nr:uncharacterized protein SOCEGT47_020490 [Sorangium cellulosum]